MGESGMNQSPFLRFSVSPIHSFFFEKGVMQMLELIPNQLGYPLLSLLILVPVIGSLVLLFIRGSGLARTAGLVFSLVELALCVPLLTHFNSSLPHMQFGEVRFWISAWNIQYKVGIDGISILFVVLTALLTTISIMVSWRAITDRVREFMIALLFLEAGMIGVFISLDLFLFYIFWE